MQNIRGTGKFRLRRSTFLRRIKAGLKQCTAKLFLNGNPCAQAGRAPSRSTAGKSAGTLPDLSDIFQIMAQSLFSSPR